MPPAQPVMTDGATVLGSTLECDLSMSTALTNGCPTVVHHREEQSDEGVHITHQHCGPGQGTHTYAHMHTHTHTHTLA